MTKISRLPIESKDMGKFINNFWVTLTLLQDKDEVKVFLKDLLTHTEMKMLAKRLQIARMLLENVDYRVIRNYVKVTDQTISRINNLLNGDNDGFVKAVYLLQKFEEKRQKELEESYNPSSFKKYPGYKLPDLVIEAAQDELKRYKRRKSVNK